MARPIAVLCLLGLSLLPSSAGAIVVHGLNHGALGAATVASVSGSTGPLLEIGNIGSSGQDGVSIDLAGANGVVLRFASPPVPRDPIVGWDLELRKGGTTITVVGSTFRSTNALGQLEVGLTALDATALEVEVWDGPRLVLSKSVAPGTPVIRNQAPGEICDDVNSVRLDGTRSIDDGVIRDFVWTQHSFPSTRPTVVDGVAVSGDRYVLRAGVPLRFDASTSAYLHGRSSGGGAGGAIYVAAEGLVLDPPVKRGTPRPSAATVVVHSGAVLAEDASGGVAIAPDGGGDDLVISVTGLHGKAPNSEDLGHNENWNFGGSFLAMPDPGSGATHTATIESRVTHDPDNGLPVEVITDAATWTSSVPGVWVHDLSSSDPATSRTIRFRSGGLLLHESTSASYTSNHPPVGHDAEIGPVVSCQTTHLRYASGTVITISGQPFAADEVEIASCRGGGTTRSIKDIRLVHPPSMTAGHTITIMGAQFVPSDQAVHGGGRGFYGNGPRQTTSQDGSRYRVRNLGSSGQDGVEIPFHGMPSVDLRFAHPPLVDGAPPVLLALSTHPCDDGSCGPSSRLEISNLGQPGGTGQVGVEYFGPGSEPFFGQVGSRVFPLHVADLDGDGAVDVVPVAPGGVVVGGLSYQEWARLNAGQPASTRTWVVDFIGDVTIQTPEGPVATPQLRVWRDRLETHFETGKIPTEDEFARLDAVAPDAPSGDTYGVSEIVIEEPGVATSSCAAPGTPITIHGLSFAHTYAKITGTAAPREPEDDDCDGFVIQPERTWTSAQSSIVQVSGGALRTVVGTAGLVAVSAEPEATRAELSIQGSSGGGPPEDLVRVRLSTGGGTTSSAELLPVPAGAVPNTWTVRSGGVVTGTIEDATALAFTSPPTAFAIGDLDRDGHADVLLTGFPAGTQADVDGALVPCDRIDVTFGTGLGTTDIVDVRLAFPEMPYPIPGVRFARAAGPDDVVDVAEAPPSSTPLALGAPSPNPFLDATHVRFALAEASHVRARVVDVAGREVARLADARYEAGAHVLRWNGRTRSGAAAPAGLYFVRVERAGGETAVTRVARLR